MTGFDSFEFTVTPVSLKMLPQSVRFYTFHYQVLRVQMFEECDSSSRQLKLIVAPFSKFTIKFGLDFVLTLENTFS